MEPRADDRQPMEQVLYEVKKVIVGQDQLLERLAIALLSRGHVLVEGVPGLAKTLAIKTLADSVGGQFQRIQFTPDLVPADLVGTRIYNQRSGEFTTSLGPVFTNLLLADEINRAPAKVQSALLEVMQERQVTIGRETHAVPNPFLVMATQNPIESEGTYPLPEAQVDRFMLKVLVSYPSPTEEFVIVERMTTGMETVRSVLTTDELLAFQRASEEVYVDPALIEYAVRLVGATREPRLHGLDAIAPYVLYGASPRAAINLILAARSLRVPVRAAVRAARRRARSRARRHAPPTRALVRSPRRRGHSRRTAPPGDARRLAPRGPPCSQPQPRHRLVVTPARPSGCCSGSTGR